MLIKLEVRRAGVNGLSFHPRKGRPWVLASLDSGVIEIWNHRNCTLIHTFEAHDGAVRGVHFHNSKPYFVSGGDDSKIKVWNYKTPTPTTTPSCLLTLEGHSGWVRTVQFHHKEPLIVSASDDKTVRIWNRRTQTCIAVLTGHSRRVMCASFHPNKDLVLSASLDSEVRVWDIGGVSPTVKYILPHDGGVNWASFHPTLPQIVSGTDDRQVKLWRMDENEASEVVTLLGHMDTVSSATFHARHDVIVSSSKDKSIRVWDKQTEIQTLSRDWGRFRMITVHPEFNILAAGHDNGMILFKLDRKRPAFAWSGDSLFYAKDCFLRRYQYSTQKDSQVIRIRRPGTPSLNQSPRTLSYSPAKNAILICSDLDGGSYELYIIPKDDLVRSDVVQDAKRGKGGSAVFIAPHLFAVLDKSTRNVQIKNLKNKVVQESRLTFSTDAIFYAGYGKLLCRSRDGVVLFDTQQRCILGNLKTPFVRYVVWAPDMESVALLSKNGITIASKTLDTLSILDDPDVIVKSGAWGNDGVFVYTTSTNIKCWHPNEVIQNIQTMEVPIYITKVSGNVIFYLDRDGENSVITINEPCFSSKKRKSAADGSTDGDLDQDGINSSKKRKVVAETANEKPTRIWWDLENAPVPRMYPQAQVYSRMLQTLRESNLTGPVTITGVVGYLDSYVPKDIDPRIKIDRARLYNRPPNSRFDQAADSCISLRIREWLAKKEEPCNVMFITGDTGFCEMINEVKAAGHSILVAFIEGKEEDTSAKIKSAAEFYWEWRDFLSWTPEAISCKERKAQWLQNKVKQSQRGKGSHDKKMRKEKRRKEKRRKEKRRMRLTRKEKKKNESLRLSCLS